MLWCKVIRLSIQTHFFTLRHNRIKSTMFSRIFGCYQLHVLEFLDRLVKIFKSLLASNTIRNLLALYKWKCIFPSHGDVISRLGASSIFADYASLKNQLSTLQTILSISTCAGNDMAIAPSFQFWHSSR